MSEHTPGPWISNTEHSAPTIGVRVESEHAHGEVNDGWIICSCEGPDSEANGRLLAAAPDLLAACEGIFSCFGPPETWEGRTRKLLERVRAAVVKAKYSVVEFKVKETS